MTVTYLHLYPDDELPDFSALAPLRAVVIIEASVTPKWQARVSTWLIASGCLYMMAWGIDPSSWDTTVDLANLEAYDFDEIPDDKFVMTTWHDDEALTEVFWFAKNLAYHPTVTLPNTLLLHIAAYPQESALVANYNNA